MSQKTNIIYLTTKCNMACEYCYEGNGDVKSGIDKPPVFLSDDQIDQFVDEMEILEGGVKSSTIAIMGGEPTLAYDELKYFINRIIKSSKKLSKSYYATLTTNGVLLSIDSYYERFIELLKYSNSNGFRISLEVSYDGTGHYLRRYRDFSPTEEIVKSVIDRLDKDNNKFRISYTVSEKNYNSVVADLIRIFESYKNLQRIHFNIAFGRIDSILGDNAGFSIKEELKPYMNKLYKVYGIPICEMSCDQCNKCNRSMFDGHRFITPTKGISTEESKTVKKFDKF